MVSLVSHAAALCSGVSGHGASTNGRLNVCFGARQRAEIRGEETVALHVGGLFS